MKVGKSVLIAANVIICLSFGFFVLIFHQVGKPYVRGFYCDDDSINKPFKRSTISSLNAVLVTGAIAIPCFLLGDVFSFILPGCEEGKSFLSMFKRTRKIMLRNFIVVTLIFLHGMGITTFITDIGKYSVGRLRPHFYDVCRPNWAQLNCTLPNGVRNYFVGDHYCSQQQETWKFKDARLSFPSGHSSFAAYCATFLILHIENFIPVSNPLLCLPKLFIQIGLGCLALFCGLSRISDYKHHPTDVLAGLLLGFLVGVFVFTFVLMRSCMPLLKVKETSMESVYSTSTRGGIEDPPIPPVAMVMTEPAHPS